MLQHQTTTLDTIATFSRPDLIIHINKAFVCVVEEAAKAGLRPTCGEHGRILWTAIHDYFDFAWRRDNAN